MSSSPTATTSTTRSSTNCSSRPEPAPLCPEAQPAPLSPEAQAAPLSPEAQATSPAPTVAVIACGALGGHIREIAARRGCFYLNRLEAEILAGHACPDAAAAAQAVVARGGARVLVTDGPHLVAEAMAGAPTLTFAPPAVTVARVTGAGDCFLAAHLAAELAGQPRDTSLRRAVEAAAAHVSGKDVP